MSRNECSRFWWMHEVLVGEVLRLGRLGKNLHGFCRGASSGRKRGGKVELEKREETSVVLAVRKRNGLI